MPHLFPLMKRNLRLSVDRYRNALDFSGIYDAAWGVKRLLTRLSATASRKCRFPFR